MPFGLSNAPRTFIKAINKLLGDIEHVKIYIDDILVHSYTISNHMKHLEYVLNRLFKHEASVNFKKSHLCQTEIHYLGHIINGTGIKADISSFYNKELTLPVKPKDLQKLLGFMNWFRIFIKNYAALTQTFYKRIHSNDKKITYTEEEKQN
ncbi:Retrovirus-related Pol polyprotein from transposon opus [Dictyocoela muelleri]|nr:Retrovirus-related Pol polyprotein from transposon opus [Dictyocoela muelleri]